MSQFETTGGGIVDSGDKRIERKVVVSTAGDPTTPSGAGRLTNVSITQEPGGIRRGVFEFTQGGEGGASYNAYGKKIELMAGSREVPIINHPTFAALTPQQVQTVTEAVENKTQGPFASEAETKLFGFLVRGVEYFLAPSVIARVSEIESSLPRIAGLCKVADPSEVAAPTGTFWVLTGLSATPLGDKYEVTREYTSIPTAWEDVDFLYNNW